MPALNVIYFEKRLRNKLNDVNLYGDVRVLREDLVKLFTIPETAFDIVYAGQVLKDGKSLDSYGLKNGVTLHAVSTKEEIQDIKPEPFDERGITQLLTALHSALINPIHRHAVYTILSNPDTLKNIAATTPGLTSDHVAMAFLRDADLIIQISDPDNLKKIVEKHPAIGHAALQIAASSVGDISQLGSSFLSDASSRLGSVLSNQEPGFMSDEEMDTSDSSNNQSSSRRRSHQNSQRRTFSASQLTAALNASRGAAANSSNQSSSANNASAPGLQPITVDMFTQAMAHALQASTSSSQASAPPSTAETVPPVNSNPQLTAENLQEQMQTLRDMGFPDDQQNLEALQASNGIVQGALDLIISQLY